MHFTYVAPDGDLCQGDVLRRTEAINAILTEVHPHYLNEDYKLFMILTQSCDLVRRSGACGSRYLEIATVRPVEIVIQRQLETYQDARDRSAGVCTEKAKTRLVEFIKTLLNNNATEYFFLYPELSFGFSGYMCAFLRESIPLRAYMHYNTALEARIASLDPTFQAKLGWLVGQNYSRVATDDWATKPDNRSLFEAVSRQLADGSCVWVEDKKLRDVKNSLPAAATGDELRAAIATAKSQSKKMDILGRVCKVIEEKFPDQYPHLKNLEQTLSSDNELKKLF